MEPDVETTIIALRRVCADRGLRADLDVVANTPEGYRIVYTIRPAEGGRHILLGRIVPPDVVGALARLIDAVRERWDPVAAG